MERGQRYLIGKESHLTKQAKLQQVAPYNTDGDRFKYTKIPRTKSCSQNKLGVSANINLLVFFLIRGIDPILTTLRVMPM